MNPIGALLREDGSCSFTVWSPTSERMDLHIVRPDDRVIAMTKDRQGYFRTVVEGLESPIQYAFRPNGGEDFPDPASHFQPEGVHGPSEVVDHCQFLWTDQQWKGIPFHQLVLYELHVGTFTPQGTFESIIARLDDLCELGVNGIELMPVAQFPGGRNWGYDGVFPYAVQNSYGGPEGLKRLVDACHAKGIAVFLDVVYNHIGPEGNYFRQFGPYFTEQYRTPWGDAINFDGEWADGVRAYFAGNALHWMKNYHLDGLRCDAVHAVFDNGAVHFWELLHQSIQSEVEKQGRSFHLIAESDLNSPRVIRLPEQGGYGFRAQWLDDFHHALYVLVDPKGKERYQDFGRLEQLGKAYTDGFVHSGEYVSFRKRKYGASSAGIPGHHFVVFNQNHDQVGNRVRGERLCHLVDKDRVKVAAAATLLSPCIPMLFMGEEYADKSPFFYFVSHSDKELIEAVQAGRKEEFRAFNGDLEPPDPQDEHTFLQSKLHWNLRNSGFHQEILAWHRELIKLRKSSPAPQNFHKDHVRVNVVHPGLMVVVRLADEGGGEVLCLFNFSDQEAVYPLPAATNGYRRVLDSHDNKHNKRIQDEPLIKPGSSIRLSGWSVLVIEEVGSFHG